jgi:hypothetical protein
MFTAAMASSDTLFYGYANSDLLFDESLVCTLRFLCHHMQEHVPHLTTSYSPEGVLSHYNKTAKHAGFLLTGRRFNVNVSDITDPVNVLSLVRRHGAIMQSNAQDYFISTREGLPWHLIPPLVVGRVGYDNWLLANALYQWPVPDASCAVLAVHQTDHEGNKAALNRETVDSKYDYNKQLIGAFNYKHGSTDCIAWALRKDRQHRLGVMAKRTFPPHCYAKTGADKIIHSSGICRPLKNPVF